MMTVWMELGVLGVILTSEICAQSGPPSENTDLDKFPVITSQAQEIAKQSLVVTNRKSTTSFPTSYRCSACVTLKSRKGDSKNDFLFFE